MGFYYLPYPHSVKVFLYWILKVNVFSHNFTISFNTEEQRVFNFYLLKIIHRFVMNWIGKESKKIPCWIDMLIHNKPFRMVKFWADRGCFEYLLCNSNPDVRLGATSDVLIRKKYYRDSVWIYFSCLCRCFYLFFHPRYYSHYPYSDLEHPFENIWKSHR